MMLSTLSLAVAISLSGSPSLATDLNHTHEGSCLVAHSASDREFYLQTAAALEKAKSGMSTMATDDNGNAIIDVAVWYRPTWAEDIGDQEIERRVARWFAQSNTALSKSGVKAKLVPVFVREMGYEGFGVSTYERIPLGEVNYISWMDTNPAGEGNTIEGYPTFHETSRAYGADLHLWLQEASDTDATDGPLGGGSMYGRVLSAVDQSLAPMNIAYADTAKETHGLDFFEETLKATGLTIIHEFGHTFGLQHELADGEMEQAEPDAYASSCGAGNVPGTAATVMWSVSDPIYNQRGFYSSPDISVDGEACGNHSTQNQARVASESVVVIANYAERPAALGSVSFGQAKYTVLDGQEQLIVDVLRDGDLSEAAEVEVALADGGAKDGIDFDGSKFLVSFQPGQDSNTVSIPILDFGATTTRTFDLALKYPLRLELGDDSAALVEIQGDDGNVNAGTFSIDSALNMAENDVATITVTRSGDLSSEAVLTVQSRDGSGVADLNYFPISETLRFLPDESQKEITVRSAETDSVSAFSIDISSQMNAAFDNSTATVNVYDGDKGEVSFTLDDAASNLYSCYNPDNGGTLASLCTIEYELADNTLSAQVTLTRYDGSAGDIEVTIEYVTEESSAGQVYGTQSSRPVMPGSALNATAHTVLFSNGEVSKTVSIEVANLPDGYPVEDGYQVAFRVIDEDRDFRFATEPEVYLHYARRIEAQGDGGGDPGDGSGGGDESPVFLPTPPPPSASSGSFSGILGLFGLGLAAIRRYKQKP